MAQVITGAKALVKLSGDVLAFATGVSVTHENLLDEIPQLDNLEVAEYAEGGHRCSVTINTIKLSSQAQVAGQGIFNSANSFGFDPDTDLRQILLQPEIIIEIVETVPILDNSGQITGFNEAAIYRAEGAKFAGGSGSIDARGVWTGQWNFKCRRGTGI